MWTRRVLSSMAGFGIVNGVLMFMLGAIRWPDADSRQMVARSGDIAILYCLLGAICFGFAMPYVVVQISARLGADRPESTDLAEVVEEQAERIARLEAQVEWLNARLGPPAA